jgi:hypothetical protein
MHPPYTNDYCLERAAECERLAEEVLSEQDRKILLDLAKRWRALAKTEGSPPDRGELR